MFNVGTQPVEVQDFLLSKSAELVEVPGFSIYSHFPGTSTGSAQACLRGLSGWIYIVE
jgi:hypothetical protein